MAVLGSGIIDLAQGNKLLWGEASRTKSRFVENIAMSRRVEPFYRWTVPASQ
jgi:hypothetical protein